MKMMECRVKPRVKPGNDGAAVFARDHQPACPGRSAAPQARLRASSTRYGEAEWCAADPGPRFLLTRYFPKQPGSRICAAPFRFAPRCSACGTCGSQPILRVSLLAEKPVQRSLAVPRDIADPPSLLELDEIEHHGGQLAEALECHRRARLVGGDVTHRDVDGADLPILRIDEGIAAEHADLAGGLLAVLDDERCERGREIAPD